MAGLLVNAGFRVTAEKNTADIWLLNSCKSLCVTFGDIPFLGTVKTPSETQLENQIREAKSQLKKVVVAGCVSQVYLIYNLVTKIWRENIRRLHQIPLGSGM
jgi:threonylcarbamoyladenosine tRNA methylthiotransferase CDKAL1